jgi:hypothetical protein
MAEDLYIDPETLDFQLTPTGDFQVTTEVVKQDVWKMLVLAKGNFVFDPELGSLLYTIPRYGNTRAARELAKGYIRLAVDELLRDGKLAIDEIEITEVTRTGFTGTITYRDLTTGGATTTIDF